MTKDKIGLLKFCLGRYEKIQYAFQLIAEIIKGCKAGIAEKDVQALDKALSQAVFYQAETAKLIALCKDTINKCQYFKILDKDAYKKILLTEVKLVGVLYRLNLLLFKDVLLAADFIEYYLDHPSEGILDASLDEFYIKNEELLKLPVKERMEKMGVADYTDFCRMYPKLVSLTEFKKLVNKGLINSVDDIIVHKGKIYENEFSEEWEEYEYEYDKYRKNKK